MPVDKRVDYICHSGATLPMSLSIYKCRHGLGDSSFKILFVIRHGYDLLVGGGIYYGGRKSTTCD
jgi:hypothetical protein